jgi:hypothetical protein
MTALINSRGLPGIDAAVVSTERQVFWEHQGNIWVDAVLDSTIVDAGSTPTTSIRAGLLVARRSDGLWYVYDPDAINGDEVAYGIITEGMTMLDNNGTAVDKAWRVMVAGYVKADQLLLLDANARAQMAGRFLFDDDLSQQAGRLPRFGRVQSKATDYTVVAADNGSLFVTITAAATYTLPTKANGLSFEFLQTTDNNMVIASAGSADDIIVKGDAGADTVTFSTTSEKIGSRCRLTCVYVGGALKWIVENLGGTTMTVA